MTEQEKSKKYPYGAVRAASKTPEARLIAIEASITGHFAEGRSITVGELEGNQGYVIAIENQTPEGQPFRDNQRMWLTEKSFIGLYTTIGQYLEARGYDKEAMLDNAIEDGKLSYTITPNIEWSEKVESFPEE